MTILEHPLVGKGMPYLKEWTAATEDIIACEHFGLRSGIQLMKNGTLRIWQRTLPDGKSVCVATEMRIPETEEHWRAVFYLFDLPETSDKTPVPF